MERPPLSPLPCGPSEGTWCETHHGFDGFLMLGIWCSHNATELESAGRLYISCAHATLLYKDVLHHVHLVAPQVAPNALNGSVSRPPSTLHSHLSTAIHPQRSVQYLQRLRSLSSFLDNTTNPLSPPSTLLIRPSKTSANPFPTAPVS